MLHRPDARGPLNPGLPQTPRTKASVDVAGTGGVAAGGGTEAVSAGADDVAPESGTGTTADL